MRKQKRYCRQSIDETALDGISALDTGDDHGMGEIIKRDENEAEQRGHIARGNGYLGGVKELIDQLRTAPKRREYKQHGYAGYNGFSLEMHP